ncbi:General secretion pathway protein D [hydrothermal vent metagenome]|uniref:General secretion pathway protein D n=1 Tax=hydrothermal vent metagenome TaxID=652676 RepID=A0A3B0ZJH1_9ZZZZ
MSVLFKKSFKIVAALTLLIAGQSLAVSAPSVSAKNVAVDNTAKQTYTLNFVDADINALINAVSRITGINFIIDPRVKGKVTIISNKEMPSEDVYQVFLSVLKVHGFAAVVGANVTKIVPEVNAKQDAIPFMNKRFYNGGDAFVTRVIEVRYIDAAQLVPILRPLVPQRGHLAAYPASNVLVISDSAANIMRLEKIIRRIDQATSDEVEVIPLEHATATEVVRIMQQLASLNPKQKKSINVIADDRTNSVLLGGPRASRVRTRALISHLDTPLEFSGNTHVIYLRNAVAKDMVPVLTGVSKSILTVGKGKKTATSSVGGIVIEAHESTNSLVISAPANVVRSLKTVIQRLDIRRAQVLVEAVIAEVSEESTRELGVQWAGGGSNSRQPVGLINFDNGYSAANLLLDTPPVASGLSLGVGDFIGTSRIGALIRALSADVGTNILSTPSLVTIDNKEAEIVVGQNVPFITGAFSGPGGGGANPTNPFTTIQRQDVGLTLKIKPQINEGNSIKLDVQQEVSSLSPSTVGADLITNKRSIKTTVMVEDGGIVVLGGLIEETLREDEQRVPVLGDIPILGLLFRYNKTTKVKTNLMVFIHPQIMKDAAMLKSLTNDKYNFIRAKQLAIRERGVKLMADDESPLLPEFKEFLTLPPAYDESTEAGTQILMPPVISGDVATTTDNAIRLPPSVAAKKAPRAVKGKEVGLTEVVPPTLNESSE